MKHMRQFLIILFFTCIGEVLHEFIPAAVGLIQSTTSIKPILIQSIIIMMISTFVVMVITGKVSMLLRKENSDNE